LKPWEFEQLQPHEFLTMLDGQGWRNRDKENMFAYFTCHLMNLEGKVLKEPISPADLLKPLRDQPEEKKRTTVAELMEKFKGVLREENKALIDSL
jgi:hypothetical protein